MSSMTRWRLARRLQLLTSEMGVTLNLEEQGERAGESERKADSAPLIRCSFARDGWP